MYSNMKNLLLLLLLLISLVLSGVTAINGQLLQQEKHIIQSQIKESKPGIFYDGTPEKEIFEMQLKRCNDDIQNLRIYVVISGISLVTSISLNLMFQWKLKRTQGHD